jgi:hypothetical protein
MIYFKSHSRLRGHDLVHTFFLKYQIGTNSTYVSDLFLASRSFTDTNRFIDVNKVISEALKTLVVGLLRNSVELVNGIN